uniref:Uncharacterized protein n=1 Tax=Alexandrium catenella TaxID=2925 RepID=A0A7S1PLV1_ALECA
MLEIERLAGRTVPCGFAMRQREWKLVLGYGGGPDTWCNKSSEGLICKDFVPPVQPAQPAGLSAAVVHPQPPLPACLKTGFCLWDVVADPGEHVEISARHPDVVAALKAELLTALTGYRAYQLDRACGAPTFEHDQKVGSAWAPWCDSGTWYV